MDERNWIALSGTYFETKARATGLLQLFYPYSKLFQFRRRRFSHLNCMSHYLSRLFGPCSSWSCSRYSFPLLSTFPSFSIPRFSLSLTRSPSMCVPNISWTSEWSTYLYSNNKRILVLRKHSPDVDELEVTIHSSQTGCWTSLLSSSQFSVLLSWKRRREKGNACFSRRVQFSMLPRTQLNLTSYPQEASRKKKRSREERAKCYFLQCTFDLL